MNFKDKVLKLVAKVPEGKVTTYKKIAEEMEKPKAYRAVGNALAENPDPINIPCHRIVKSNGEIGGYSRGIEEKKKLLKSEGVEIQGGKIDLDRYFFGDF